VKTEKARPL